MHNQNEQHLYVLNKALNFGNSGAHSRDRKRLRSRNVYRLSVDENGTGTRKEAAD
jgi:hypothetical protein